jgi:hypothetical protein
VLGFPAQLGVGTFRIGSQIQHVACPPANDFVGQIAADGFGEGLDHVIHGAAFAGSQVPGSDAGMLGTQVVQGDGVAAGQVEDVDVVADGGAVFGCVVCDVLASSYCANLWEKLTVTENKQLLPLANSDLRQEWQKVVWDALRIFSHNATRVATSRVEVPQQRRIELFSRLAFLLFLRPLGVNVVCDHGLHGKLGVAVRIGGSQRALFWDGNHVREASGVAIYCRRRGEDNVGDLVPLHRPEQRKCASHIDAVVLERNLRRLADCLQRSKVDHVINVWVLVEDLV